MFFCKKCIKNSASDNALFFVSLKIATTRSKLYQKLAVVGLYFCLVCRFVAHGSTAPFASVNNNKSAFGVGKCLHGAQNSAAIVGSVTGIYINVKRAKAKRTVISRCISEREHLASAIFADEARIILFKAFIFHKSFTYAEF